MRIPDNNRPLDIRLICGTSGAGKSHGIKQTLRAERGSVFVFDVKNEYGALPGFRSVHTRAELVAAARRGGRIAYTECTADGFDFFCSVIWARGDCLCIAEELSGVTSPGKASGYWHRMLTQGRGFGIRTIGLTQRPAEIDKTIVGNRSLTRVHRLEWADDRKYAAKVLDCSPDLIAQLRDFEFVEKKAGGPLILPARLQRMAAPPARKTAAKSARR